MPRPSVIDPVSSPSSNSIASRNQKLNNTQVHTIQQSQQQQEQQQQHHQTNLSQKSLRKGSKVISWLARKLRKSSEIQTKIKQRSLSRSEKNYWIHSSEYTNTSSARKLHQRNKM
uniref:Serine/threonine-protein kinase plk-1 (Polo-like kinase 1) n=1 Tax=Apis cerana TaxID=7461 RepID=V9IBX0_APICE